MYDQFKGCIQRCLRTEIIRTTIHLKRILSTEKTSEKVIGKKNNDTSSNGDNVGKGKWYATDETENNLMGFVAKHQLKARNGKNLLNIKIKKHHAWINPKRCRQMGSRQYGIGGGCAPTGSTH